MLPNANKRQSAEKTRQEIQRAALTLFAEKGVEATTIKSIARHTGLSEGALYRHYVSKDALGQELFTENFSAIARVLADIRESKGPVSGRLTKMIHAFTKAYDHDPILFRFLLLTQHGYLENIDAALPSPIDEIRQIIIEGMTQGKIPHRDPNLLTAMVMGIVLQTATFSVYGRITGALSDVSGSLAQACWQAMTVTNEQN